MRAFLPEMKTMALTLGSASSLATIGGSSEDRVAPITLTGEPLMSRVTTATLFGCIATTKFSGAGASRSVPERARGDATNNGNGMEWEEPVPMSICVDMARMLCHSAHQAAPQVSHEPREKKCRDPPALPPAPLPGDLAAWAWPSWGAFDMERESYACCGEGQRCGSPRPVSGWRRCEWHSWQGRAKQPRWAWPWSVQIAASSP